MYLVEISNREKYVFNVSSGEHQLVIDAKGGNGIKPLDALLASLGSCIGVYIRKYAESAKLEIPEFSIKVEADFGQEKPICFRKIDVNIDLKGANIDERRQKAIHEFVKNCPVHNTFKVDPEVTIKINA